MYSGKLAASIDALKRRRRRSLGFVNVFCSVWLCWCVFLLSFYFFFFFGGGVFFTICYKGHFTSPRCFYICFPIEGLLRLLGVSDVWRF